MSVRVSLRGMLRLIRFDTLHRMHDVGFFVERLKYVRIVNNCIMIGRCYRSDYIKEYISRATRKPISGGFDIYISITDQKTYLYHQSSMMLM